MILPINLAEWHVHEKSFAALNYLYAANDKATIQTNRSGRQQCVVIFRQIDLNVNIHVVPC